MCGVCLAYKTLREMQKQRCIGVQPILDIIELKMMEKDNIDVIYLESKNNKDYVTIKNIGYGLAKDILVKFSLYEPKRREIIDIDTFINKRFINSIKENNIEKIEFSDIVVFIAEILSGNIYGNNFCGMKYLLFIELNYKDIFGNCFKTKYYYTIYGKVYFNANGGYQIQMNSKKESI